MPIPFSRSMRSLEQDRFLGAGWILAVGVFLLAAWLLWFFYAEIKLYEVTEDARLEVAGSSRAVEAVVSGRVIANYMMLDLFVEAGDLLVEFEADAEQLSVEEGRSRAAGLADQVVRLGQEIASEEAALAGARAASRLAIEEAEAGFTAVETRWRFLELDYKKKDDLHRQGIGSQINLEEAKSAMSVAEAEMKQLSARINRLKEQRSVDVGDRRSSIDALERDMSDLRSRLVESESAQERLDLEVDYRSVRAPVSGRLGEVAILREGAFVAQGDKLCSIVPVGGELLVAAHYLPAQALGRVRPGQAAELRLDGYPWAQWGTVSATVDRVGSEVGNGRVRVELAIIADEDSLIPLDHGLPGALEIEVERVSPAALVLRSVGKMLSRPMSSQAD